MSATNQSFQVSGLMIEAAVTGSHALQLVLLCGISAGSVVVPLAVTTGGLLITVSGSY